MIGEGASGRGAARPQGNGMRVSHELGREAARVIGSCASARSPGERIERIVARYDRKRLASLL